MTSTWREDFIDYLINEGYTQKTAKDYAGRVKCICESNGIDVNKLASDIDFWIDSYDIGIYADINKGKHNTLSNALKRFKEFLMYVKTGKVCGITILNRKVFDLFEQIGTSPINHEATWEEIVEIATAAIKKKINALGKNFNCFYIMYNPLGYSFEVQETWHIDGHNPLKCLKLSYDLSKKFESEGATNVYILYGDKKTRVEENIIRLALLIFGNYTMEDYYNEK